MRNKKMCSLLLAALLTLLLLLPACSDDPLSLLTAAFLKAGKADAIVLTCGVLFVPALCKLFGLTSISPVEFLIALGLAFITIPFSELAKLIRKRGKNHADA